MTDFFFKYRGLNSAMSHLVLKKNFSKNISGNSGNYNSEFLFN